MQTNQLKRVHKNTKRMIVARGGKRGKTSGRGGKGQSARAGNKRRPEWRDIIKKLPKLRGRGVSQNKPISGARKVVNLVQIEEVFKAGEMVNPSTLVEKGVIYTLSGRIPAIKILGDGEITKAIKVSGCFISDSAKEKIEKAGGSVTVIIDKVVVRNPGAGGVVGTPKVVVPAKAKKVAKMKPAKEGNTHKAAKEVKEKKPTSKKESK